MNARHTMADGLAKAWWPAFVVACVMLVLKAPDAFVNPQFWAEDGTIFFFQQHVNSQPLWFKPYAGYLLFIPRFVAWLAADLPAWTIPAFYNMATLLIGAAALSSLRGVANATGIPYLLLLAPVGLTPTNIEVFGNLTNVQWLTQFYLLVVVVRIRMGIKSAHPSITVLLVLAASLTGPFSVFTAAALVVSAPLEWFWQKRTSEPGERGLGWLATPEIIALMIGAAVQACVIRWNSGVLPKGMPTTQTAIDLLVGSQQHLFPGQWLPVMAFAVLLTLLLMAAAVMATRRQRFFMVFLCAVVSIGMTSVAIKCAGNSESLTALGVSDRYFLLSKVAFWWLVFLIAYAMPAAYRAIATQVAGIALFVSALVAAPYLRRPPLENMRWQDYAERIDRGDMVSVPINPRQWTIHLPARPPLDER